MAQEQDFYAVLRRRPAEPCDRLRLSPLREEARTSKRRFIRRHIRTTRHGRVRGRRRTGELIQKKQNEEALTALEARFSGDEEMELLLLGIREGLNGKDLQEAIGVDAKRLEALRTRLTRELKKLAAEFGAKEGRS